MALTPQLASVRMIARDPERLAAFYERAFGFVRVARQRQSIGLAALLGVASVEIISLQLGDQQIELVGTRPSGRPYPGDPATADTLFQHIALVVPDMAGAVGQLEATGGFTPISHGPQRLPPNTGGVSAFKFRDPEGHPLEFLSFPRDAMPSAWKGRDTGAICLGYDHSAIVVADTQASLAFYAQLGFRRSGGSLNVGPEQERLDDVPGARVAVTSVADSADPPHLELLAYGPETLRSGAKVADIDVAATQLVLAFRDRSELLLAISVLGSKTPVDLGDGTIGTLVRDPDGHRLLLCTGVTVEEPFCASPST